MVITGLAINKFSRKILGSKGGGGKTVGHEKGACYFRCGLCTWFCHKKVNK